MSIKNLFHMPSLLRRFDKAAQDAEADRLAAWVSSRIAVRPRSRAW